MSELNLSTVRRRYYPVKTKLSAVRDRVINEIGYAEVLAKYEIKPSTFHGWLHKYKSRVLAEEQHERLSSRNYKMLYTMTDQERHELESLRQEVEKQKILVEAHELMLELARERLHVDVKKTRGDTISGIVERQKKGEVKPDRIPLQFPGLQQAGLLQEPSGRSWRRGTRALRSFHRPGYSP